MADLLSFFIHRDSREILIGNPTSHDESATVHRLKYRGHHADWFKGLWRLGRELEIMGCDDSENETLRASVLARFPTRAALIEHAKLDADALIVTTQAEADGLETLQPGQRLIADGDLCFPHLASAGNIAVSAGSHAEFPALTIACEIIVWGSANFIALASAEKVVSWGRGIYWALRQVGMLLVPACGNPLFPALESVGTLVGNGLGRLALPRLKLRPVALAA